MDEWEPELALRLIDRHQVTSTHMVATHFHRLLSLSDAVKAKYDTKSLTYALHGAVPTPVDIKQRMMDWWGPVIYEYYGSSEVGGTLVTPEQWLAKPGTVGLPFSITRLEILDDDGNPVPNGEPGWIYMRQGDEDFQYHNDPDKTANVSRGELVCVGDIGYLDEDGYLFLCGRDAEIIISGGVNIYPAAIEGHLLGHDAVQDVAVVGVPDDEFGEQVKAVVVTKPGHSAGAELEKELIQHCRDELSHITCPKSVDFVDDLPRDPSGKMYKQRVRDQYWQGRTKRI
jgi:long-chain acyl-CoA synthetase